MMFEIEKQRASVMMILKATLNIACCKDFAVSNDSMKNHEKNPELPLSMLSAMNIIKRKILFKCSCSLADFFNLL